MKMTLDGFTPRMLQACGAVHIVSLLAQTSAKLQEIHEQVQARAVDAGEQGDDLGMIIALDYLRAVEIAMAERKEPMLQSASEPEPERFDPRCLD